MEYTLAEFLIFLKPCNYCCFIQTKCHVLCCEPYEVTWVTLHVLKLVFCSKMFFIFPWEITLEPSFPLITNCSHWVMYIANVFRNNIFLLFISLPYAEHYTLPVMPNSLPLQFGVFAFNNWLFSFIFPNKLLGVCLILILVQLLLYSSLLDLNDYDQT